MGKYRANNDVRTDDNFWADVGKFMCWGKQ
jgi:hypothetical protein